METKSVRRKIAKELFKFSMNNVIFHHASAKP